MLMLPSASAHTAERGPFATATATATSLTLLLPMPMPVEMVLQPLAGGVAVQPCVVGLSPASASASRPSLAPTAQIAQVGFATVRAVAVQG
jgi:hypothetical protein